MPQSRTKTMHIAEFSERSGLTRDTIRFYVRKGLLQPDVDSTGTNRYQRFGNDDVEQAMLVRFGQQLGFTLREILALKNEFGTTTMSVARQRQLMANQLAVVEARMDDLKAIRRYFQKKITWLDAGAIGIPPEFVAHTPHASKR